MSDPGYVPVPERKSARTDDFITCLEAREEVAPTTANDTAYLGEMDRAPSTRSLLNKMCKRFNQSMAMGSVAMGAQPKRNPKHWKAGMKENYRWVQPCFNIKNAEVPYKTTSKPIVVAIWATCKLCKFKSPGLKSVCSENKARQLFIVDWMC